MIDLLLARVLYELIVQEDLKVAEPHKGVEPRLLNCTDLLSSRLSLSVRFKIFKQLCIGGVISGGGGVVGGSVVGGGGVCCGIGGVCDGVGGVINGVCGGVGSVISGGVISGGVGGGVVGGSGGYGASISSECRL